MTHPIPFYKVGRVGYSREPTFLLLEFIVSTFHLFYLPFTIPSIVAEAGLEPAQPLLAKGFSYHTCFYTSNLNAFYYAIHFIGAGVGHLLFKILWSGLFLYHIRISRLLLRVLSVLISYCMLSVIILT